jgi:protocatechuate 3,4-dioxygenase beta subunit
MKNLFLLLFSAIAIMSCSQSNSQKQMSKTADKKVGGNCEGCKVIYESPVPFGKLNWIDTLPDFNEEGPKLVISGIIYKADGITPAQDVVLYIYHTDQAGKYANRNNEKGNAGNQGYIKGWMKTNEKGQYKFYTLKPASYPGRQIPAHIHPTVKEPNFSDYWIDEYLFDDDTKLTVEERKKQENRGGSGIISLTEKDGIFYGERNIYLGKNIDGYPQIKNNK